MPAAEELVQVRLISPPCMWRGGAKKPGGDGPADRLAKVAEHLAAGESRDGVGRRGDDQLNFHACMLVRDPAPPWFE